MARIRTDLPHNAVKINGVFLEDVVTGFTTLRAKGRELVNKEINLYDGTRDDGRVLNYSRYPEKEIIVEFVLGTNNYDNYAPSHEALMQYLDINEAEIIFNDEPDKYYIGSLSIGDIDKKSTFSTGSYTILCADPFKYDVNETTVTTSTVTVDDVPITALTTNNTGGYKTFPKFEVQFADNTSSAGVIGKEGECGYILLGKGDYGLQFGNDEEKDTTVASVSTDFRKITLGSTWKQTTTLPLPTWSYLKATPQGTSKISTTSGLQPNSYGTAVQKKYYGPMAYATLSTAAPSEFTYTWSQIFALSSTSTTAKKQLGIVLTCFYDATDNLIFAFGYKKSSTTKTTGDIVFFDSNGIHTLKSGVSFAYTGKLGYKKSGSSYVSRKTTQTITKYQGSDDEWHVRIDTPFGTFYKIIGSEPIKKIGVFQGKYGSNSVPYNNAYTTAKFISGDIDVVNTFQPGDLLEVNCDSATVKLNDSEEPSLGDISNDWSNFYLDRGNNTIFVQWSDWVDAGYEPTIVMKYRKRWL